MVGCLELWMARPENHDHLPSSGSNLVTSHHGRNYKNADATFKIIIMHFWGGVRGLGEGQQKHIICYQCLMYHVSRQESVVQN